VFGRENKYRREKHVCKKIIKKKREKYFFLKISKWNILLESKVIHPAQGVLKVMNHPISVTTPRHLTKMPPPENQN